jgi:membrane protease YdiL (CAAX protease family)
MKAKRQGLWFYLINYGLSVLFIVPVFLLMSEYTPENPSPAEDSPLLALLQVLPMLAPAIAAFIIVAAVEKKAGLKDFCGGFFTKAPGFIWIVLAVLVPITITALAGIFNRWAGGIGLDGWWTDQSGGLFGQAEVYAVLIVGGICEEIGWRQFFLPRLAKKHGWMGASLIVSICWWFWHLAIYTADLVAFAIFFVFVLSTSILMTWVFVKGGQNLLLPAIMHCLSNAAGYYFGLTADPETIRTSFLCMALAASIPAVLLVFFSGVFRGSEGKEAAAV